MRGQPSTSSSQRIATILGEINLRVSGKADGPAMVCWPSLLMDGRMWQAQAEHFGDRYRMLLVDSPGHGDSEPLRRNFTLEECALCLRQILDALSIKDCVLVGNSWGGMMGGVFAALYPERTRAAVLMNCTASAVGLKQRIEFLALSALVSRLHGEIPAPLVSRAVKAFAGPTTEKRKPEVIAQIREGVSRARPQSVHWAIRSVVPMRRDQHTLMGQIRCPVLVATGAEDRTFPVEETRAMAHSIPGSRFVVLPEVGHLAALEAPAEVNAVIDEIFGSATTTTGKRS